MVDVAVEIVPQVVPNETATQLLSSLCYPTTNKIMYE